MVSATYGFSRGSLLPLLEARACADGVVAGRLEVERGGGVSLVALPARVRDAIPVALTEELDTQ